MILVVFPVNPGYPVYPFRFRLFGDASVGFDAAWELDFRGKFKRSIQSADVNLMGNMANYDDVLVTLTAEVARTYVRFRTSEERIFLA